MIDPNRASGQLFLVAHAERTIESLLEAIQLDGFNDARRRCYPSESE